MEIEKIINIIKENNDIINRKYNDVSFEVIYQTNGQLWLYIENKYVRLPNKKYLTKLKRLFEAKIVMFVPENKPPMWAISLNLI